MHSSFCWFCCALAHILREAKTPFLWNCRLTKCPKFSGLARKKNMSSHRPEFSKLMQKSLILYGHFFTNFQIFVSKVCWFRQKLGFVTSIYQHIRHIFTAAEKYLWHNDHSGTGSNWSSKSYRCQRSGNCVRTWYSPPVLQTQWTLR